ncbi:unnamed protein product, partial [marine sediment metagenome]
ELFRLCFTRLEKFLFYSQFSYISKNLRKLNRKKGTGFSIISHFTLLKDVKNLKKEVLLH